MAATTSPTPSWRSTRTASSSALRVSTLANMGAYLSTFAPCVPTYLYATLLAGAYTTPAIYAEVKAVFTNTVPVDAYRGAGPAGGDLPARAAGGRGRARDRASTAVELRRRNFIPPDAFPYQTPVALQYDSGDYDATLDVALEDGRLARASRRAGPRRRKRQAARHRHLDLHRGLRHRAVAPWSARSARAPGSTRSAQHPRPPDRQRHRLHRHRTATARATRRPSPSSSPTSSACRSTQVEVVHGDTGEDPVRHGHLRQPHARGRRLGDGQGDGQDHRQGQEDRRPSDGSRRSTTSSSRTATSRVAGTDKTKTLGRDRARRLRAAQLPDRGARAGPRRDRLLRPEELHLSRRLPHLRGRDRPRDRRGRRW